ncbi:hypothetical protein Pla175_44780 [Pirellulimonas nuda]|uniref:Acid-resistance membrane protein n=1 Tax=Pirellulimonas nuda TaxID=2528009 RepID=A0A518DHV3_9BACT|nr:DUF308 domain-containing protein [Pirellulimonas nuda]QDU91061.1 hypothetical protein Pla175_44780 [Pirellulimonas nuda]
MPEVYLDPRDDEPGIPVRPVGWQFPLLQGLLLVAVGLLAVVDPKRAVEAVTQLIGALLVLQGLLSLWQSFGPGRRLGRGGAVFTLAVGLVVLLFPLVVSGALATVLMAIAGGVIVLAAAVRMALLWPLQGRPGARWAMLGAVLNLALGLLLLCAPLSVGLVAVRVLGACALLAGVGLVGIGMSAAFSGPRDAA